MTDLVEDDSPRAAALTRIKARRGFYQHLIMFVLINAVLVGLWATTGRGYFWPAWVLIGWGIGLGFNAWEVFGRPISEDDIRREMERGRHHPV
jgi:hypothetical protein